MELGKIQNLTKTISKQNIALEKQLKELKEQQMKEKKHRRKESKGGLSFLLQSPRKKNPEKKETRILRKAEDFQVKSLLGRGAYGEVFLATENSTKKVVAIKRMLKSFIVDSNQVRSIKTELDVLKKAAEEDSNNIVRLHYSFSTQNYLFLAMVKKKKFYFFVYFLIF